ncbi:hypothetical protein B0H13DRAFT_2362367 [Mycena leptocephala]|nr:hypothetical protein B0H13DRAFT_2362367 [Mycena leptocephala]
MDFWWLLALVLPCTVLAVPQNNTIDDTSPLVDYYQGLHCSPCPDEFKNYGLDPAQLSNGTFSAFENNGGASNFVGTQDNGLSLRFNGTAIYVYLAVPAAANLSTPVKCSFILDSIPEAGADFSMNSPPEVNQYNVLAYAKTDIPDGSHILNMDVGDTPVVFDYAYYTVEFWQHRCYFISREIKSRKYKCYFPNKLRSLSLNVRVYIRGHDDIRRSDDILSSHLGFLIYIRRHDDIRSSDDILSSHFDFLQSEEDAIHPLDSGRSRRGSRTHARAVSGVRVLPQRETHQSRCAGDGGVGLPGWSRDPEGDGDGLVGNGSIQDHRGTAGAAQMQNQSGNGVPLRHLTEKVQRLEGITNGKGSDIVSLVSTSMEGSCAVGSENASRARSFSMMKRDQMRALHDHERGVGVGVSDTLVHTDSGLRLTAGRVVDEVPPSYVAD